MNGITPDDFPADGHLDWHELAKEIGPDALMKVLERGGGRLIWMLSPATVIRNKNNREYPKRHPRGTK